jgi:hypothetical protein
LVSRFSFLFFFLFNLYLPNLSLSPRLQTRISSLRRVLSLIFAARPSVSTHEPLADVKFIGALPVVLEVALADTTALSGNIGQSHVAEFVCSGAGGGLAAHVLLFDGAGSMATPETITDTIDVGLEAGSVEVLRVDTGSVDAICGEGGGCSEENECTAYECWLLEMHVVLVFDCPVEKLE